MKELVLIVWGILILVTGLAFFFVAKKKGRKLNKYIGWHKFGLLILALLTGWSLFYFLYPRFELTWSVPLLTFLLGALNVRIVYLHKWTERHIYEFKKDSFWVEYLLIQLHALVTSAMLMVVPQLAGIVDMQAINLSASYWSLPFVFFLPYLIFKLTDMSGQIPFRITEKRWVYPLEPLNIEQLPWRNFMQINFQLKRSLVDEYTFFSKPGKPWIEAPQEAKIGDIFRMMMQNRIQRADLTSFQDMGNEYQGQARFWWLFSIKLVWWNPLTWSRSPRYLDPDKNVIENKLRKYDIIRARRIPMPTNLPTVSHALGMNYGEDTVIINR